MTTKVMRYETLVQEITNCLTEIMEKEQISRKELLDQMGLNCDKEIKALQLLQDEIARDLGINVQHTDLKEIEETAPLQDVFEITDLSILSEVLTTLGYSVKITAHKLEE